MCITNNFIEQEAYDISQEIRKCSIYKVVKFEVSGSNSLEFHNQDVQWNGKDLVTKVILEDSKGIYYSISPDNLGLRFAKGEITYREYKKLIKADNLKVYGFSFLSIGILIMGMFTMMKFLI